MRCPDCSGLKKRKVLLNFADKPCEWRELDCFTCNGTGEITEEHQRKIEIGKAMRRDRLNRGLSQSDEAKRRGMTGIAYSKLEHGQEV
jgi:hypothetical protein